MPRVKESIVIDRSREDIRAFLKQPEMTPMWQSNLVEYAQIDEGDPGKGTRHRGVVRVAGRRVEWTSEITEWDPVGFYEFRSLESPFEWRIRYDFEEEGDGTRMSFDQEIAEVGGFFGKLADPLVTRMYARDVKANLGTLKDLLESGTY